MFGRVEVLRPSQQRGWRISFEFREDQAVPSGTLRLHLQECPIWDELVWRANHIPHHPNAETIPSPWQWRELATSWNQSPNQSDVDRSESLSTYFVWKSSRRKAANSIGARNWCSMPLVVHMWRTCLSCCRVPSSSPDSTLCPPWLTVATFLPCKHEASLGSQGN